MFKFLQIEYTYFYQRYNNKDDVLKNCFKREKNVALKIAWNEVIGIGLWLKLELTVAYIHSCDL